MQNYWDILCTTNSVLKKILENYAKQRHTNFMNSGEEGNT